MNKKSQKSYFGIKNTDAGRIGGFTLMELLVVVLLIGILSAVAFPQYQLVMDKIRFRQYTPVMTGLLRAQQAYFASNGTYTMDVDALDWDIPHKSRGSIGDHKTLTLPDGSWLRLMGSAAYLECYRADCGYQYYLDYASGKQYCNALPSRTRNMKLCQSLSGRREPEKVTGWHFYPL